MRTPLLLGKRISTGPQGIALARVLRKRKPFSWWGGSISSILSEPLAAARPGRSRKEVGVAKKRAYQQQLGEAKQTETKP